MDIDRLPEANPRDVELVDVEIQPNRVEVRDAIDLVGGVEVLADANVLLNDSASDGSEDRQVRGRFARLFNFGDLFVEDAE